MKRKLFLTAYLVTLLTAIGTLIKYAFTDVERHCPICGWSQWTNNAPAVRTGLQESSFTGYPYRHTSCVANP